MATPQYLLDAVLANLDSALAADQLARITATSAPYMDRSAREALIWDLTRRAAPLGRIPAAPHDPDAPPPPHDPDAAAAYFAALGVRVQPAPTTTEPPDGR